MKLLRSDQHNFMWRFYWEINGGFHVFFGCVQSIWRAGAHLVFVSAFDFLSDFLCCQTRMKEILLFILSGVLITQICAQQNFLLTSGSITLSGERVYNNFTLGGNAIVNVAPFNGTNSTGVLVIRANYIRIGMWLHMRR